MIKIDMKPFLLQIRKICLELHYCKFNNNNNNKIGYESLYYQ